MICKLRSTGECQKVAAGHQAHHPMAWTYTMSIQGPGRDVRIRGTLKPSKRSAEEAGLPPGGPFTVVRSCDTMMAQVQEDARLAKRNKEKVQDTQEFDTVLDEELSSQIMPSQWLAVAWCSWDETNPGMTTFFDGLVGQVLDLSRIADEEKIRMQHGWWQQLFQLQSQIHVTAKFKFKLMWQTGSCDSQFHFFNPALMWRTGLQNEVHVSTLQRITQDLGSLIEHSFLGRLHPRTCHVEFQWIWPWEIDEYEDS